MRTTFGNIPTMSVGTLTLDRFNGQEQFSVEEAVIYVLTDNGTTRLNFEVTTGGPPLNTLPDTEELRATPDAEFTVAAPGFSWDSLVGSHWEIPLGYDPESDDYVTRIYYCEHEETDDNLIKVIEREGMSFRVRITGTCTDVNFYDGSKPRTKVTIDAWFTPRGSQQVAPPLGEKPPN
jgi:hypothetical protein